MKIATRLIASLLILMSSAFLLVLINEFFRAPDSSLIFWFVGLVVSLGAGIWAVVKYNKVSLIISLILLVAEIYYLIYSLTHVVYQ
jgi:hypothetical protein